jgi:signal transduction histidine kinase
MALWFATSLVLVSFLFSATAYFFLRHELQYEQWERAHPENPDFVLHGSYSKEEIDDITAYVLKIAAFMALPVAGIALLLGRSLARKSLRPVSEINAQLHAIGTVNLNARVQAKEADTELADLTQGINALLQRVERGYREVADFSAQVAHELRTPLTLMRLQLEEASASIEPELAESLQDELQRLESYVDQCLLITRAERGQLPTEFEPVSLATLVADVAEPFSLLARESQRDLTVHCAEDHLVDSVPWIVRQILHNLLSNALKHGSGMITVEIDTTSDGPVIRVHNATQAKTTSGTGLGLRIVDALVRSHGQLRYTFRTDARHYTAILTFLKK